MNFDFMDLCYNVRNKLGLRLLDVGFKVIFWFDFIVFIGFFFK